MFVCVCVCDARVHKVWVLVLIGGCVLGNQGLPECACVSMNVCVFV